MAKTPFSFKTLLGWVQVAWLYLTAAGLWLASALISDQALRDGSDGCIVDPGGGGGRQRCFGGEAMNAALPAQASDLAVVCSYVTHNYGDSWYVRTEAPAAELAIRQGDYGFMQSHPGGHFCVRVMLQQAGAATRIVNGRQLLPDGSVRLCPQAGG